MGRDISKLRGQGDASKAIFQKVRQISEEKGTEAIYNRPSRVVEQGGGAFASMNKKKQEDYARENPVRESIVSPDPIISKMGVEIETIRKVDLSKYLDTLFESLVVLNETKDYASVVRGLMTYYCAGKMGEFVIEGVNKEDKQEILGIIKDFENTVKNTLR